MPRVNVYLPDDLAGMARSRGINISRVTQEALRREITAERLDSWLDQVAMLPSATVDRLAVLRAIHESRDELGSRAPTGG